MVTPKRRGGVGRVVVATLPSRHVLVSLLAAMVSYNIGYDRGFSAASHAGLSLGHACKCDDVTRDDVPGGRAGRARAAMDQLIGDGSVAYPRLSHGSNIVTPYPPPPAYQCWRLQHGVHILIFSPTRAH